MKKNIIIPKIDFYNLPTPEIEKKAFDDINDYINSLKSPDVYNSPTKIYNYKSKSNVNIPKLDFSSI